MAEELCGQLYDGDENETQRVVVPRVAGIIFASLGRAAASTTAPTRGGTNVGGGGASLRVRAVLARLEQDGGAVARRFVLEDFDVFGDGGAGEGSRRKGRRSKGRTKRVPLPTTYASLLEEANSPCPSPGSAPCCRFWDGKFDGVVCTYPGAALETHRQRPIQHGDNKQTTLAGNSCSFESNGISRARFYRNCGDPLSTCLLLQTHHLTTSFLQLVLLFDRGTRNTPPSSRLTRPVEPCPLHTAEPAQGRVSRQESLSDGDRGISIEQGKTKSCLVWGKSRCSKRTTRKRPRWARDSRRG